MLAQDEARRQRLVRRQVLADTLRSDVLIAGAGIAGLVLARELARTGLTVTLVEAGGTGAQAMPAGHDPFGSELRGQPHAGTREGRVCGVGGCSVTWGGQLLPMPQDADGPVPVAELVRYVGMAESLLGVDGLPYDAEGFFAESGQRAPELLQRWNGMVPRLSKYVPFSRRNLGALWGAEVAAHPRIKLLPGSRVAEVVMSPDRDRVLSAAVMHPQGLMVHVRARHYVLAAGAVECCRVLLESHVGVRYGQVGLGFGDHLTIQAATFAGEARGAMLRAFAPWVMPGEHGSVLHSPKVEMSQELRARLGIAPGMAHVTVEEPEGTGVEAVRTALRTRQQGSERDEALSSRARRLLAAMPAVVRLGWGAKVDRRRYVSDAAKVSLQLNMAQSSQTASKVSLSADRDVRGRRNAAVEWHVSSLELEGLRVFAAHTREQLKSLGLAEDIAWEPALFSQDADRDARLLAVLDDARHAMGGARMGTDPRTSVVNADLRVHGVDNLSVASTAVFPDGSPQLPTLTLVLLCLRLAERLRRELR